MVMQPSLQKNDFTLPPVKKDLLSYPDSLNLKKLFKYHMRTKTWLKSWTFLLILAASCNASNTEKKNITDPLASNRDTTINPAQDFFYYANGGWFKAHPIPPSERSNGIFRTIQDTINDQIRRVCEESAKGNAPEGSNKQKI